MPTPSGFFSIMCLLPALFLALGFLILWLTRPK